MAELGPTGRSNGVQIQSIIKRNFLENRIMLPPDAKRSLPYKHSSSAWITCSEKPWMGFPDGTRGLNWVVFNSKNPCQCHFIHHMWIDSTRNLSRLGPRCGRTHQRLLSHYFPGQLLTVTHIWNRDSEEFSH